MVMLILKSRGAAIATAFYGAVESAKLHAALVILFSEKDKEDRGIPLSSVFGSALQSILP